MAREEQNSSGNDNPQHISMELTADGARVTSLSLKGSRLVLTIEAKLADSQLNAGSESTDVIPDASQGLVDDDIQGKMGQADDADSAWPVSQPEPGDKLDETIFVDHSGFPGSKGRSFGTEVIGALIKEEPEPEQPDEPEQGKELPIIGLAPEPEDEPLAADDDSIIASISLEPAFQEDDGASWDVQAKISEPDPAETDTQDDNDAAWTTFDESAVAAPQLEPVRDLTETWDTPTGSGQAALPVEGVDAPISSAPQQPAQEPAGESAAEPDIKEDGKISPAPPLELVKEATESWDEATEPATEMPSRQEPEPALAPSPDDLPAITDESSLIGGERHGEPQPAISFGITDQPPEQAAEKKEKPAPEPEPEQEEPETKPESGGTTVLIRYTCPRCKTQGMQAVDKVGTVVNCSNCGKAMRLVMKK